MSSDAGTTEQWKNCTVILLEEIKEAKELAKDYYQEDSYSVDDMPVVVEKLLDEIKRLKDKYEAQ